MLGKKEPQRKFLDHYVYERHLPGEQKQGMEHEVVVADTLYDSAENRKAFHEGKTPDGERLRSYIPSRQKEKTLKRFRYEKGKDRVVCPARQVSIGKSPPDARFSLPDPPVENSP